MRFNCKILLTKNELPLEYRRCIISFLKNAISETKNVEFFEKYFSKDVVSKKPYTFFCQIPVLKKEHDKFLLKNNEITLHFSTKDTFTYFLFRNALSDQKNKPFLITNHNFIIITNIYDEVEKDITSDAVIAKTRGNIVICETNGNNKERKYFSFGDENFVEKFFERTGLTITPIECKTVKTLHFSSPISTTVGTFLLQGSKDKIKEAYLNGIGDRSSQGYGYIDII